jgi:hypothetical protein
MKVTQHKKAFNNKSFGSAFSEKFMFMVNVRRREWASMRGASFSSANSSRERKKFVGNAKHENIIKIIYFSAAIVVFPHPD